jgi:hypothetical protein
MAKHIHEGWSTSEDEIAQPVGIVLGRNLRKPDPVLSEAEKVLASIKQYIANEKKEALERFPLSVNRRDSQRAANKILWSSRTEEAGDGVFERSASSGDPGY